jgi:hypothetical protein
MIHRMDDLRLKRPYLESLTTGELVKLADTFGVDIPPEMERIFIIAELLDMAVDVDGGVWEETPLVEAGFLEAIPLPRQYNITFIEVMIRDPLWAFVFWEIKSHDKEIFEKDPEFGGYQIKVLPLDVSRDEAESASFTVSVGRDDTAWYLGFPPSGGNGGRFKVELRAVRGAGGVILAVSRPFRLPRLLGPADAPDPPPSAKREGSPPDPPPSAKREGSPPDPPPSAKREGSPPDTGHNPLIKLSGVEEFDILRSAERPSRLLQRWNG